MTQWVYSFDEPLPGDAEPAAVRAVVGGKGASLREMTGAGLRVPPGFTITTEACRAYFDRNRQWPSGLEEQVRNHLARLESASGRRFGDASQRLLVSVRSGAAVSMPGMMDTLLNCGSSADPWAELVAAINAVFESWNSERAVAYRQRHDIRGLFGTAVNVQAMFPSEVSGVAFTRDPNDPAASHLILEASYGLGEVVVSGEVTPDRFLVEREDRAKFRAFPGSVRGSNGAALTSAQVAELAALALKVEAFYGHPVDIEWGLAGGEFALLQSRAIRGLDVQQELEAARLEEIARLRAQMNGHAANSHPAKRRVWVAHNLGETLRFPTPLTWDIIRRFMCGDGGFGRMYRSMGYRPSKVVREEGFLELICGRIYADPERLAGLFWDAMPLTYDAAELAADRTLLDRAPAKFDANRADTRFLAQLVPNLWGMFRASGRMKRQRRDARRVFEYEVLPPFLDYVQKARARNLSSLDDAQLVAELHARRRRVLNDFGPESLKCGFFGGIAFDAVRGLLGQLMGEAEGGALASDLVRGLDGDTTFQQDALLYEVAHGEASMDEFLDRFGHRAIGEMELSQPRWREEPMYLHQTLGRLRNAPRSPEHLHGEAVARRQHAEAELPKLLERWGGSCLREQIERDLVEARDLLPFREAGKHYLMMGYELLRLVTEEMSRRWGLGNRLYFLSLDELPLYGKDRAKYDEVIARRRTRWQAMQRLEMPDVIDSDTLDALGQPAPLEAADELAGASLAAGIATGVARVVFDPQEAGNLGVDYVLVCPSTDPGWTPLFLNARGLVVERGGVLSHGAIVARDFGIPAVVCPNATRQIQSGDRLRIDGTAGKVLIVSRGAEPPVAREEVPA